LEQRLQYHPDGSIGAIGYRRRSAAGNRLKVRILDLQRDSLAANEAHLLENLGARSIKLSPEDVQAIDTSMSKFPVYGDRMGKDHMQSIDYSI